MNIADYRREYTRSGLSRKELLENPFQQFELWFQQACDVDVVDANAMTLATVSKDGRPTLRTVLIKTFDERGFVFFTNYSSQKARQIEENPNVALLFPWTELDRQIEITGIAEKIAKEESLEYFFSRPRGSQIGAWTSHQSQRISSRSDLLQRQMSLEERFANEDVPPPEFWGGYRVVPETIEFWQGRINRLHDRFQYNRNTNGDWLIERLAP